MEWHVTRRSNSRPVAYKAGDLKVVRVTNSAGFAFWEARFPDDDAMGYLLASRSSINNSARSKRFSSANASCCIRVLTT